MALDIKSLANGQIVKGRQFMVFASSIAKTKSNKDYLMITLGNKTGKIEGRLWTLPTSFVMPRVGDVVCIDAAVTEFNSQTQLNIATLSILPAEAITDIAEFTIEVQNRVPAAEFNQALVGIREELIKRHSTLLLNVLDNVMEEYCSDMLVATAACGVHHAGVGGWAKHTIEVLYYADAIYNALPDVTQLKVRRDILLLGAFLHDVGKLRSYTFDTGVPVMTETGKMLDHIVEGITIVHNAMHKAFATTTTKDEYESQMRDVYLLEHIIASHHTELEYGSPVNPITLEAVIVGHADCLSASLDTINEAIESTKEPWTQKIFTQHNRQFTTSGVNNLG